jgi:hypothetical protein
MAELTTQDRWHFVARAVVSLLFGVPAIYIVFKGEPVESVKWATGVIGVIIGYWLR